MEEERKTLFNIDRAPDALEKINMLKPLRILIVDDQLHARRSLKALLATRFNLTNICEADNGIEAVRCVEECKPDIVVMDARMPEMDGIEATRIIKSKLAQIPVIVLTLYTEYRAPAMEAGANAFLIKGEPVEQLLAVLIAACSTN
jgi:DNA-binding NarL/FixJ family response regulator